MTSPNSQRQKGTIILSRARSGTNWLKSINDGTGRMGILGEWLSLDKLEKPPRAYTAQSYYDYIMPRTCTPNGRFSMKIFPRHFHQSKSVFKFDFVRKCAQEHDVKFYLITREDRLGQAISMLKAQQSNAWTDKGDALGEEKQRKIRYNFRRLCSLYFEIGQGYDFWRSYLEINGYDYEAFTYETLMPNPAPFFESAAKHLEVPPPESYQSALSIQRNALTEEWRQRFQDDIASQGIHPDTDNLPQPDANVTNALKVLVGKPIKPSYSRT